MELYSLIFYVFSFLALISAFMVIISKNPVYSVLWLVGAFFNVAGLFILAGAEFLAMVMIIVYVGAIAVLFLFVVMMLNVNYESLRSGFHKLLPLCILLAIVLAADLYLVFNQSLLFSSKYSPPAHIASRETITKFVFADSKYEIANFEDITNTESLGQIIYTDYFYCFQLAGVILLVAMISSIALTLRDKKEQRRQDICRQVSRTKKKSLELAKVNSGEGVDV